jgi:hypothetical protein
MARVRIICISDTHGQHAGLRVPDGDILIHAGDFMTCGNAPREIIDFNTWLARQPHAQKIVIAGNHDRLFESHPIRGHDERIAAIAREYAKSSGGTLVVSPDTRVDRECFICRSVKPGNEVSMSLTCCNLQSCTGNPFNPSFRSRTKPQAGSDAWHQSDAAW